MQVYIQCMFPCSSLLQRCRRFVRTWHGDVAQLNYLCFFRIFEVSQGCLTYTMARRCGFRVGYMSKEEYHRRLAEPEDKDFQTMLHDEVERWSDLPMKQCERLRLGGQESLGLVHLDCCTLCIMPDVLCIQRCVR